MRTRSILYLLVGLLVLAVPGVSQVQRVNPTPIFTTPGNTPPGANAPMLAVPGSRISIYQDAAGTIPQTTYSNSTGTSACPTFAQISLVSGSCVSVTDAKGNWGFWVSASAPATLWYKVTYPNGQSFGPFPIPGNTGGGSGGGGIVPPAGDIGGTTLSPTVVSTHLTVPLPLLQGGNGTATPSLVAGTNVTITGTFPNQTINSTGSGGVSSVTGTSPIVSTGGSTPAISISGVTSEQGNGAKIQLSTGTTTTNNCVKFDANGNTVDAGAACGTGGSTPPGGTTNDIQINNPAGTFAADTGILTHNSSTHTTGTTNLNAGSVTTPGTIKTAVLVAEQQGNTYSAEGFLSGTFTGAWNSGTAYTAPGPYQGCQVATSGGQLYMAVAASTNVTPSGNPASWWPIPGQTGAITTNPTQLDCAFYTAAAKKITTIATLKLQTGTYDTCYGLIGPTVGNVNLEGMTAGYNGTATQVRQTCQSPNVLVTANAVISITPFNSGSFRYNPSVRNIGINANGLANHCLDVYGSKLAWFQNITCTLATGTDTWIQDGSNVNALPTQCAASGSTATYCDGYQQFWDNVVVAAAGGASPAVFATIAAAGSIDGTITPTSGGTYQNTSAAMATVIRTNATAVGPACTTMPTSIVTNFTGSALTNIVISGSLGCTGTVTIQVPDITQATNGFITTGITDSSFSNFQVNSIGTTSNIEFDNGNNNITAMHPFFGIVGIRDAGAGNTHFGDECDSITGECYSIKQNDILITASKQQFFPGKNWQGAGYMRLEGAIVRPIVIGNACGSGTQTSGGYRFVWSDTLGQLKPQNWAASAPFGEIVAGTACDGTLLKNNYLYQVNSSLFNVALDSTTAAGYLVGTGANTGVLALNIAAMRGYYGYSNTFGTEARGPFCISGSATFGTPLTDCYFAALTSGLAITPAGSLSATLKSNPIWIENVAGSNHGIIPGNMPENVVTSTTVMTVGGNCVSVSCKIIGGGGNLAQTNNTSGAITLNSGSTGFVSVYIDEAGQYQVSYPSATSNVSCTGTCTATADISAQPGWIGLYQYAVGSSVWGSVVDYRTILRSLGSNRATAPNTQIISSCNNCTQVFTAASNTISNFQVTLTGNQIATPMNIASGKTSQIVNYSVCSGAGGPFTEIIPGNMAGVSSTFSVAASTCANWTSVFDGTNYNAWTPIYVTPNGAAVTPGIQIAAATLGGSTTIQSTDTASNFIATLPNFTGTLMGVAGVNTFTAAGTANFSASTVADAFRVPVKAGATAGATGSINYDSTNSNLHMYNGADAIIAPFQTSPTTAHCVDTVVASGKVTLHDSGAACGTGSGGGVPFAADTTNSGTAYTNAPSGFVLATGALIGMTSTAANSINNPTLNVNSTGVKTIVNCNGAQTLQNGDMDTLANGQVSYFAYNGTAWVLQNPRITNCGSLMNNNAFAINGRISGYNGNSTSANGVYAIYGDTGFISNRTTAITTTTLAAWQGNTGELWDVKCSDNVRTVGTGTVTITIGWTNGNSVATTTTGTALVMTGAAGSQINLTLPIIVGAGNITYAATAPTTGAHDLRCTAARGA